MNTTTLKEIRKELLEDGHLITTEMWQGMVEPPEFLELLHVSEKIKMGQDLPEMQKFFKPDLPWADVHFDERIGGIPLNPPPSHTMWLKDTNEFFSGETTAFSHSYPERFWPKSLMENGIRFNTGDLSDLIKLLTSQPLTRQAYLPIFFPEDIHAATLGERIPCTLGYHFILRNGTLDVLYPMRSCDAVRHLHNDLYFTNRLALYVNQEAKLNAKLGIINFVATSLHCFSNDRYPLSKLIEKGE